MTHPAMTKICNICGEEKPLSAFLTLTSGSSNRYSATCANCRKKAEGLKPKKDTDESTASTSGLKIDAKAKIHLDRSKQLSIKERQEDEHEEKTKQEEFIQNRIDNQEIKNKNEQKHRDDYLKKHTFLSENRQNPKSSPDIIAGSEDRNAKEREMNFQAPVLDTQIAGKVKHQSAIFNQFKSWLGESAPIARRAEQERNAQQKNAAKQPESPTEYAKKTWGPKSK